MSMNTQKYLRTDVSTMLQEAQLSVRQSVEMPGGKLYELEPSNYCGRRALIFESKEKGITVAIRMEIPESSPFRNLPVTTTDALMLLGALTFVLQAQDMEAKLISGKNGLEAIIISRHLCGGESDQATLSQQLDHLQSIIQAVEPVLSSSGQTLISRIFESLRPQIAAPIKEALQAEPIIVPTFDEEARNRMLQQIR